MTTNGDDAGVVLAPGADASAFATMLADLVRQNLATKPHKRRDFDALDGTVALVADDADVAVTLAFVPRRNAGSRGGGHLTLYDGIKGVPDVTVRGSADAIMALSNIPLSRPLGLPVPTDRPSLDVLREMVQATRTGALRVHGILGHLGLLARLTRVMSVNG
jgi:hypothetical protein